MLIARMIFVSDGYALVHRDIERYTYRRFPGAVFNHDYLSLPGRTVKPCIVDYYIIPIFILSFHRTHSYLALSINCHKNKQHHHRQRKWGTVLGTSPATVTQDKFLMGQTHGDVQFSISWSGPSRASSASHSCQIECLK